MTTSDDDDAKRLRFERYVLDLDRGCLLLDNSELALRPKTFAVLKFLVENAGRLVSKDDLITAVWSDVTVTDDTLVQSIGELRRALREDGARLIKTVPRRGYRFEAAVSTEAPFVPEPPTPCSAIAATCKEAQSSGAPIASAVTAGSVWPSVWSNGRQRLLASLSVVALLVAAWGLFGPGSGNKAVVPQASKPAASRASEIEAKPAVAILPFANNSGGSEHDYFADGLTQDIINALGRFSALTVMSWNAVASLKGKPSPPADVARSLRVRYQVEGSVQRGGGRARVTAQLVDATGRVLWTGRFDEALFDLFTLQDKITAQIAGALATRVTLAEQKRVIAKPTDSLEAYDLVLRARPAIQRPTRAGIVEARTLLRRAIELDPDYAAAHAALGETYHIDVAWGWAQSPATALSRAEELATASLKINDAELSAHILRGRIHLFYNRYEQAAAEVDRVLAINPSDANGHAGRGNIMLWTGRTDQAIETLELAQWIDPELNAIDRFSLSLAYYLRRRYDAAIVQAEHSLRNAESSSFSYVVLAAAYAQQGRFDDVARVASTLRNRYPAFDPKVFGNKLRNPADLEHLRDGLRKAGFDTGAAGPPRQRN